MEDENKEQEKIEGFIDMKIRKPGGLNPPDQGIAGKDF
jgi:hypothetical protein